MIGKTHIDDDDDEDDHDDILNRERQLPVLQDVYAYG
jgi:hypothetical protein